MSASKYFDLLYDGQDPEDNIPGGHYEAYSVIEILDLRVYDEDLSKEERYKAAEYAWTLHEGGLRDDTYEGVLRADRELFDLVDACAAKYKVDQIGKPEWRCYMEKVVATLERIKAYLA